MSLAAYRLARTVRVSGVYAAAVRATRGITAGAGHATVELRVLLIEYLDEADRRSSLVTLTVYVDDIGAECTGRETLILQELVQVILFIVSKFTSMRLTFSDTKNVCCASRPLLGQALVRALPELSLRYQHRVVSLGSALGAGRRRNAQVATRRLAAFVARRGRFRRLRRAGIRTDRLMRTGGIAALTFGQGVTGVSPALLLKQRRAVAAATVATSAGGDLDLTLMLADGSLRGVADPAFAAHTAPIGQWALAVWERWLPASALRRLVAFAKRRMVVAKRTWSVVCGPGAAFVASAHRLGWVVHDACVVTVDDGTMLNLTIDSPAFVKKAVENSVRRWRWRGVETRLGSLDSGGHGAGAIMQPIFRLLDPRQACEEDWGPRQRAGLRSAVMNRQWPQARLYAAGLVTSPLCQFCLAAAQRAAEETGTPLDYDTIPHWHGGTSLVALPCHPRAIGACCISRIAA